MAKRIGSTIETARARFFSYQVIAVKLNKYTTQDSWEPALKALVSSIGAKFSAAFDSMNDYLSYLDSSC